MTSEIDTRKEDSLSDKHVPYDLVLVTDATGSMGPFLTALNTSLPQILLLTELTSAFDSMAVLAYRDYDQSLERVVEWSGWSSKDSPVDLITFAKQIQALGGGDYPEAAKTAIFTLLKNVQPGHKTLVFWYADAPPHHPEAGSQGALLEKEVKFLTEAGPLGTTCLDWVTACKTLAAKNVQVFPVLAMTDVNESFYVMLAEGTRGRAISLSSQNSRLISSTTMDLLLPWMGQKVPEGKKEGTTSTVQLVRYAERDDDFQKITGENGTDQHLGFLPEKKKVKKGLVHKTFDAERHIKPRAHPIADVALRFVNEPSYAETVYKALKKIISTDVTAISLNPIFGDLWREVCKDKTNENRTDVINAFSRAVGKQSNETDKQELKTWLESSYDRTAEINEIVHGVEPVDKFPAVCLDPTESGGFGEWKREDLLEISRSCQSSVLKRLGEVLRKLVLIPSHAECPAHLKEIQKLPLALLKKKYGNQFWNILLHLVLPGTLMSTRPGCLLAALCVKIQVPFLKEAAEAKLRYWTGKWADLEVAENWSLDCMGFLLGVDKEDLVEGGTGFLSDIERDTFRKLTEFKLVELNLNTTLAAMVPFTPEKSYSYIGHTILCQKCNVNRSVTIMGPKGICGICLYVYEDEEKEALEKAIRSDTSELGEKTMSCWVECGQSKCRAAYVVYNVEGLNVRPKCHFCRNPAAGKCPWIQCPRCTNRVIWPLEYRNSKIDEGNWQCSFCEEGRETIVNVETTAAALGKENGFAWIVGKKGIGFNGRSAYAYVKEHGIDRIRNLDLFTQDFKKPLMLKNKELQNTADIVSEFKSWVDRKTAERKTCSVCFESNFKPADLFPVCGGRKGCKQKVDAGCLRDWYGLNRPGTVLNIMALHCPFCRRIPTAKLLNHFGIGVQALGGVNLAVQEHGTWVFAWCIDCGFAKRYLERRCTGDGGEGGIPLENWRCEECDIAHELALEAVRAAVVRDGEEDWEEYELPYACKLPEKICPGCGVMTKKTAGCNHITCPVPRCQTHWCYVCGDKFEESKIYQHMNSMHESYFA